jgi:hypothetical protein
MISLLRILAPLTLWLAGFSAIYGLHGIGCANGWAVTDLGGATLQRWALSVAWLGLIAAQAMLLVILRRGGDDGLLRWTSVSLAWVALIAVLWTLYPVAVLTVCG